MLFDVTKPGGVFPSIYLLFYIEGHKLFEIEGK